MTEATITDYRDEHWGGLVALHRRYLGQWNTKRMAARWRWQFRDNPYCAQRPSFIQVALCNDEVVGHLAAFPLPLRLDGGRIIALCSAAFVVEARHRLMAFPLMSNLLSNRPVLGTGSIGAVRSLYGRHGARILPLSCRRFVYPLRNDGLTCRQLRQRLPRTLTPLVRPWLAGMMGRWFAPQAAVRLRVPAAMNGSARLGLIERFGAEYDDLWHKTGAEIRFSLDKDAEYMNWRYVDCPTIRPLRLGVFDRWGSLRGIVVAARRVHRDWTDRPCGSDGEILELIVPGFEKVYARQLVVAAMRWLDRAGVDSVTVSGLHVRYHSLLEEISFEHQYLEEFNLVLGLDSSYSGDVYRDDQWYYTAGDGDQLYSPAA